jgi:hypothetical protein
VPSKCPRARTPKVISRYKVISGNCMTEWNLAVDYIPPKTSRHEGKKSIIGPADQITKIMNAVMEGRLDD